MRFLWHLAQKYDSQMKLLGKIILGTIFCSWSTLGVAQCDTDGSLDANACCDQDGGDSFQGFPYCSAYTIYPLDGVNSDIDCGTITDSCPSIPIDGGLSLLALAGGGLSTAALRRRREEEAVQEAV